MKIFSDIIIYTSTFIGAVGAIVVFLKKFLSNIISSELEPLKGQIHKMDVKECRRFLIDFLVDIESGCEKNEVQWKFAHDVYDHYTKDLNENSYVKDFWERVMIYGHNE